MADSHFFPSILPFSDLDRSVSYKSFRPTLSFAKDLFASSNPPISSYPKLKFCWDALVIRPSNKISLNSRLSSRTGFVSSPRPLCFRCGLRGHVVRICLIPVRCFFCGGFGHKRCRCYKNVKSRSQEPRPGVRDESWKLQNFPKVEATVRSDVLSLDPDIVRCVVGFLKPVDGSIPSSLCVSNIGGFSPLRDVHEAPEFSQCTPETVAPEIRDQIPLDLCPVRMNDFEDISIIDEFVDDYSDVEEVPTGANVVESESKILPDPRNLLYDEIDELSRDKEAKATDNKKNSSKCSKGTVSPVKRKVQVSKISHDSDIPGIGRKNPKTGKRGLGPIMLCSVKRSPRLSMGKLGKR